LSNSHHLPAAPATFLRGRAETERWIDTDAPVGLDAVKTSLALLEWPFSDDGGGRASRLDAPRAARRAPKKSEKESQKKIWEPIGSRGESRANRAVRRTAPTTTRD
jgi:hypothetical protein